MRCAQPAVPVGTVAAAAAAALVPVDRCRLKVCNAFCVSCVLVAAVVVVVLLMPCKNHRRISRAPDMTFGLHFELLIYACAGQASCASGI